jgi:lipopolysaccharide export system protein LptA
MKHVSGFRFFLSILVLSVVVISGFSKQPEKQEPARVKIIQADELRFERRFGQDIRRLIGNVILEHDEVLMYCDSAHMQETLNSFEAFSKVMINSGDTLFLYGDYLRYNGNTRLAEFFYNVRLVDEKTELVTEQLNYDRNSGIAYYERDGTITDEDNVLTSRRGYYMTEEKRAHFRQNVVLVNPEYVMRSDTLVYHTESQVSNFYGPTDIDADETSIYCENGWYDTKKDIAQFNENARIISGEHTISGDSLYYDRNIESALAFRNVVIVDTVQNVIMKGDYAEYFKHRGYTFITDMPLAIFVENSDSLYLHADTIYTTFSNEQEIELVKAYYGVKYFRDDLQGACDSLVYKMTDSLIVMYDKPVIWTGENQLTADSINVKTDGESIKTLTLFNSAFMVNQSADLQFNQVKGRNMIGYFKDGSLDFITVTGNAQTIYYVKEEDGQLIGINQALASRMRIEIEEGKIRKIFYFEQPEGNLFPEKDLPPADRKLKGFNWLDETRPKVWTDVFIK